MGQLYQWEPFTEGAVSSLHPTPAGPTQVWVASLSLLLSYFSGHTRHLAQIYGREGFWGSDGWVDGQDCRQQAGRGSWLETLFPAGGVNVTCPLVPAGHGCSQVTVHLDLWLCQLHTKTNLHEL